MPLLLVIVWLVLEILLTAPIADAIGGGMVLLWFLATIALGVIIMRLSGWRAIQRIQTAMAQNELPTRTLLDTLLLFAAGTLLILPGPISDAIGLVLLLPWLRAPASRAADAGVRRARPDLREPVIIEGEFEEVVVRERVDRRDPPGD